MKQRQNITADIPTDLKEADELLHRYGRWAMDRPKQYRCGSAEGGYIPERGEESFEARRVPKEVIMPTDEALACNRALQKVPRQERFVLAAIYVPQRLRVEVIFRLHKIPPRMSRERHLAGLRMFWNCLPKKSVTVQIAA